MTVRIINSDAIDGLAELDPGTIDTCITSPPYWGLRDYGTAGQIGLESTPEEYVERIVDVFRGVRNVLRDRGTIWVNLGDSYNAYNHNRGSAAGANRRHSEIMPAADRGLTVPDLKQKDLLGIPWRVAFALQADGWFLRSDIIWHKPNPIPESASDRPTRAHEYIFMLSKSARYYYDSEALDKHARDRNYTVWTVPTVPYHGAHFAAFPPGLIRSCVLAGSTPSGTVLDPFAGTGTTGEVAKMEGRDAVLIEINPKSCELSRRRTAQNPLFHGS